MVYSRIDNIYLVLHNSRNDRGLENNFQKPYFVVNYNNDK